MERMKLLLAGAVAVAAVTANVASAATPLVVGVGSSAIWQTAALGAYKSLAGPNAHHYTIKGACGSANCAQVFDRRSSSIAVQGGNLWIVWSADESKIWTDLAVDSVVGNRAFFAVPRAQLQVSPTVETQAGQGLISPNLWGADATSVPSAVYTAINNAIVTSAFTDIRPEDAKYAETRAVSTLGYGTGPNTLVGTEIKSAYSTAFAQPVDFNIVGKDPFTNDAVPASATISIGASPIIFFLNRTSASGLGKPGVPTNFNHTDLQAIFSGDNCSFDGVPVTTVQREPISGTMNTAEFTEFQAFGEGVEDSQENGVTTNPLNQTCTAGGGKRTRAIGTGELVSSVAAVPNSIGYAFFGYGNFSKIANMTGYRYETVDGVDPIFSKYTTGELPACTAPCPATPGSSFPNLRNGTYKSWSVLRVVTDKVGANYTNTSNLVSATQANVNSTVPDFVPFHAVGGDPGLLLYRSHYTQSGIAPNNGLSGQTESGGDVGGCIEKIGPAPGVLGCHQ